MKLNNIFCKNYSAGEKFFAVLYDATEDEIEKIKADDLKITMDDNTEVESFANYGKLFSIKKNFDDNTYEVEFEKISEDEKRVNTMEKMCKSLQEKIDELETINSNILKAMEKLTLENKTIVEKLASLKDTNISNLFKVKEE